MCVSRSEVKERVVWVDTKKTQVKNKAGKLKEKEITILEVGGNKTPRSILSLIYSTWNHIKECLNHGSKITTILHPVVGESEGPEAWRQTAPGGPVQHRGAH